MKNTNPFKRGLSDETINSLKTGFLRPILDRISKHNDSNDKKISLNIRNGYINLYYNGGCLAKITFTKNSIVSEWSENYYYNNKMKEEFEQYFTMLHGESISRKAKEKSIKIRKYTLSNKNPTTIEDFLNDWDILMPIMDAFGEKKERAFQQNVEFANNKDNDSFIIVDTEYSISSTITKDRGFARDVPRFDMIALEKIKEDSFQLVLIENKIGYQSASKDSGICKHAQDMYALVSDNSLVNDFKDNIEKITNQLIELGLIACRKSPLKIESISTAPVKAVFMMSQYWKKEGGNTSRAIINELETLKGLQLAIFDEKLCIEFVFLGNFKGKNIDNKYLYKDNDECCIQARDISNAL